MQKILIALLGIALLAVSGAWTYSVWSKQSPSPATAKAAVHPPPPRPASKPKTAPESVPPKEQPAEGPRFVHEYVEPRTGDLLATYQLVRDLDVLRQLREVRALDGALMLPRPLKFVAAECQRINAFYDAARNEVVLCYELVHVIALHGLKIAQANGLGDDFTARYLLANLRFLMLHETGHALIDLLELGVTGREEDAVDQLAASVMLRFLDEDNTAEQLARDLELAASFFMLTTDGQYGEGEYADEHALGEQRYYNLVCMIYGSNPARYLRLVTSGRLPESRAQRCPEETDRITHAWSKLLQPHWAPAYRMDDAQRAEVIAEVERERARKAPSPYVR